MGIAGAQHATASSINVDKQTAAPGSPKQAAEELPAGEEAGAETEGGVEGRLESSSEEQAGETAGPQEPALQSGLGQRAASNEDGELLPDMLPVVLLGVASLSINANHADLCS